MARAEETEHASRADRRLAIRLLRTAREILACESYPFPVLEAARRIGVDEGSRAWALADQARDAVGGARDERQLTAAIASLRSAAGGPVARPAHVSVSLSRVPRCRGRAGGGRCARPLDHPASCAPTAAPGDHVHGVGTDHVLVDGARAASAPIAAGERGVGGGVRVRRDDQARGLWLGLLSSGGRSRGRAVLIEWSELRQLTTDLNLELADRRVARAARVEQRRPVVRSDAREP